MDTECGIRGTENGILAVCQFFVTFTILASFILRLKFRNTFKYESNRFGIFKVNNFTSSHMIKI